MVSLLGARRRAPAHRRAGLPAGRHPRARQRDHHHRSARRGRARRAAARRAARRAGLRPAAARRTPSSAPSACCASRPTERPADVLTLNILSNRGRTIRPEDAEPEALRRRDRRAHDRLRHRPGRHRQDLPRDGEGRAGAAGQAGQPDHPDPPGGRGGGAARLPARHADREDRPLPAAAVRRAARHDRPRVDPAPDGGRDDRGRAPRVHARPHASTTPSSFSTRRRTPRPSR